MSVRRSWRLLWLPAAFSWLSGGPSIAEEIRIVTWNVYAGLSVEKIDERGDDFKTAFEVLRPDILLLQEINSRAAILRLLEQAEQNPDDWHIAISEFSAGEGDSWRDLEVAIVSRFPLTSVVEIDPNPDDNASGLHEIPLVLSPKLGVAPINTGRGFLWASIAEKKLTLVVTHLKSSGGRNGADDASNAAKREYVAAAIALSVLEDRRLFPDYGILAAGDLNVGVADETKNGVNLRVDCVEADCGEQDRYDETHAIFGGGLIGGLRMRNLFTDQQMHEMTTYPSYPGTPIDNIYVAGERADRFGGAQIVIHPAGSSGNTFGSDHRPVLTIYESP